MGASTSRAFDPESDIPDLTGKVALVTGGNAGVGFAVVRQLVRHGAKVYMGARNEGRAKAAIDRLHAEGPGSGNGEVIWLKLDLSDPREVQKAAEEFMHKEQRLDVLVNNAALLLVPYAKDYDNLQNVVMVNYVGTYLLTRALLPILERTSLELNGDVRIVAVNTRGHKLCPTDVRFRNVDDLNRDFEDKIIPSFSRYTYSKAMQIMFMNELQRRLVHAHVPILCISVNPGAVRTEGVHAYTVSVGPVLGPLYRLIARLTLTTADKGAAPALFCACSPIPRADPATYQSAFIEPPSRLDECSPMVADPELGSELWDTTERFLRDVGLEFPTLDAEKKHETTV